MERRIISCDRCGEDVDGLVGHSISTNREYNIGFYRIVNTDGEPTIWFDLGRPGEEIVCNNCMRNSEPFLERYPFLRRKK